MAASCPSCLGTGSFLASLALQGLAAGLLALGACGECGFGPGGLDLLPGGGLLLAGLEGAAALLLLAPAGPLLPGLPLAGASGVVLLLRRRQLPSRMGRPQGRIRSSGSGPGSG